MKVLLIGNGGREHAIAWKLNQSPLLKELYISPGNAGTALVGKNVTLKNHHEIKVFIEENKIDILLVGPEKPLVNGLIDDLEATLQHKCILFGPHKSGAILEGSKDFSKAFMARHNIPTARYKSFSQEQLSDAVNFIKRMNPPIVLKADGLAAGKGVLIHEKKEEAIKDLKEMFGGKFGEASKKVIIEEFLDGIEFSVFIITDGKEYILLPEAKDYKRIGEGDTGLNTGGMGAVSPVPFVDEALMDKVKERIINPTLNGIQEEGILYKGFLFFGLILVNNNPYVIEYNCRMGDPETQAVFPRLNLDLIQVIKATDTENISEISMKEDNRKAVSIILASNGYPIQYEKGYEIHGIEESNAIIFLAGVKQSDGRYLTDGGRVLAVTEMGTSLREVQEKCREAVKKIKFKGKTFRSDIGNDLL